MKGDGMFKKALDELFEAARFNPVLWLALRHEHPSQADLERFERRARRIAYLLALILAVPSVIDLRSFPTFLQLWFFAFVITYALGFGADAAYILAARFGNQIRSEFWEALRLTPLPSAAIVTGKYMSGQLRTWRGLVLESVLRQLVAAALIFALIGISLRGGLSLLLCSAWLFIIPFAVGGYLYAAEPLWRMRAVVALSFAAILHIRDEWLAVIGAIGAAFAIRLAQIAFLISLPAQNELIDQWYRSGNLLFISSPLLYVVVIYGLFYGVYRRLSVWAIEIAVRRTERGE
jgi:hypothetical protein